MSLCLHRGIASKPHHRATAARRVRSARGRLRTRLDLRGPGSGQPARLAQLGTGMGSAVRRRVAAGRILDSRIDHRRVRCSISRSSSAAPMPSQFLLIGVPATDDPRDGLSDPAVSRLGARLSRAGSGRNLGLDRRASADSLSACRADAAPDGCPAGGLDRLHLHQRRLSHGGLQLDAHLGVVPVSALAAAAGRRAELRPVGRRLLRHSAFETPGCPDLRRGAADGSAHGRGDRHGVRDDAGTGARAGGLESARAARQSGRCGRDPAGAAPTER